MTDNFGGAKVTARVSREPVNEGVLRVIANSGYGIPQSLADLIDNSIDAEASTVLIRVVKQGNRFTRIVIADDGIGMDRDTLVEAMRVGRAKDDNTALGRYGIGLKSASLSHAAALTVVSRRAGESSAVRYTDDSIADGWKVEKLDDVFAERVMATDFGPLGSGLELGTVVIWSDLRSLGAETAQPNRRFGQFFRHASLHLGLVFYRFIERGLTIYVDLEDVGEADLGIPRAIDALNPFPATTGSAGYPVTFHASFDSTGDLDLLGYIWPPNSSTLGYRLDGRAAQRQGFYFIRNDRVIQAGGWNGWRNNDAEPHFSLARVAVELPGAMGTGFALNMQKNGVVVPPDFVDGINAARGGTTTMADYIRAAEKAYRSASPQPKAGKPTLGRGLAADLRRKLDRVVAPDGTPSIPVEISWAPLADDEVFRVDTQENAIRLNESYRRRITGEHRSRPTDAPLVKTLLFLLAGEDAVRAKASPKMSARIDEINRCLRAVLDDGR